VAAGHLVLAAAAITEALEPIQELVESDESVVISW
jgi:hypothetical protein